MARPVYPYELSDPDFVWLIETFLEGRSDFVTLQESCLPVILFQKTAPEQEMSAPLSLEHPFEKLLLPESEESSSSDET
jgi:hypothetical protein